MGRPPSGSVSCPRAVTLLPYPSCHELPAGIDLHARSANRAGATGLPPQDHEENPQDQRIRDSGVLHLAGCLTAATAKDSSCVSVVGA